MDAIMNFLHLDGHGFYVWCSYGMLVFLLALEGFVLARGRRSAIERVKKQIRRDEAVQ